jgi:hypothetical protein
MRFLLITITICSLWGCGASADEKANTEAEQAMVKPVHRDSLRLLYKQFYEALEPAHPADQTIEKGKLYPVDEAIKDTLFFVFREQLKKTIAARDVFGLLDVIDKNIKVSFGGEEGTSAFVSTWQLDSKQPDTLEIWNLLEATLEGGGVFKNNGQAFYAPYVFATWPDDYEPFDHAAVIGSGVRMRSTPSLNSKIVKSVSYDIVTVLKEEGIQEIGGERHPWILIEHLDGTQGYVYGKYLQYPVGYRTGFEYQPSTGWHMVFFIAGD